MASRVADLLGIPFSTMDVKKLFKTVVVKDFIDTYSTGRTPNPCIVCNQQIRIGYFLNQILAGGADYMATGHYAQLQESASGIKLLRGSDPSKDQSYVLYMLNQSHLTHLLFPIGGYTKAEIRAIAERLDLPSHSQPESQDICFLSDGDYRRFLRRYAPNIMEPGPIVDINGRVIGEHEGLPGYTIGQRKGLGISASEPLYVLEIDPVHNSLVVGPKDSVARCSFYTDDINWVAGRAPTDRCSFDVFVKIRYRAKPIPATLTLSNSRVRVDLSAPMTDITPGQSAVFYDGDVCLGGGIISLLETNL
jgi:tRNA-specific 2-thiouridylase